jgi:hypothetical protein
LCPNHRRPAPSPGPAAWPVWQYGLCMLVTQHHKASVQPFPAGGTGSSGGALATDLELPRRAPSDAGRPFD